MTRRWLPHSLTAQLLLVTLPCLLLAQMLSMQIYQSERNETLGLVNSRFALQRLISTVRLLNDTPEELHREILRTGRTENLMLRVQNEPLMPDERNPAYEGKLRHELGYADALQIYVSTEHPQGLTPPPDLIPQQRFARMHGHMPPKDIRLYGSIQLDQARWLNFSSMSDAEPPAWSSHSIISLLALGAVLSALVIWLLRRITRPLQQLATQADEFGRGQDIPPLSETGPSEIRETLAAFNRMQLRLNRFVQDRTQMLASISHDLRTPLTSLRLRTEFLPDSEDKQKMQQTLAVMEDMLKATLSFAREDQASDPSRPINLTSLLQSLCDDYQDAGQDVQFDEETSVIYTCRPALIRRVIQNLVDNALKYAGSAELTMRQEPAHLLLQVRDHGPGIDEAHIEEVCKPFVRLDSARNTESGSVGLGLAIARTLIHRHGGDLLLRNHPDGGLEVTVQLPR